MITMSQDSYKLTPSHARTMRQTFTTKAITETGALYALENYSYFLCMGGKRPFLHNERSGIVCPMCPEVAAKIELNFGIRQKACSPYWERQELRNMRHWLLVGHRLDKAQKKRNAQPMETIKITAGETTVSLQYPGSLPALQGKVMENDPATDEFNATNMAMTPVIWKVSGGMLIALVFLDGAKKKSATVYHIDKDGNVTIARNGSCAQKYTQAELDQKGWQSSELGHERFARIFALLTNPKFEQSSIMAAVA